MHRIDAAGFSTGNLFTDGNPATGTPATVVDAAWLNDLQENIVQLIESSGTVLSKGDYTQLIKAIATKGLQGRCFSIGIASGTADAITSSYTPPITALTNGMTLYVRAAYPNSTAIPTFTPNSGLIPAKQIINSDSTPLSIGAIAGSGHWIELQYDALFDKWMVHNQSPRRSLNYFLSTGDDLNNVILSGIYRLYNNHLNSPGVVSNYGQMLVMQGGGDTIAQIIVAYTGSCYVRAGAPANIGGSGSWSEWFEYSRLGASQTWTKAQRGAISALTYAATITPDFSQSNNFSLTLTGSATLATPTNIVPGQSGIIAISQDAIGNKTLAFGSAWKFQGGVAPSLTTTANAVDHLVYYVETASRIGASIVRDVK